MLLELGKNGSFSCSHVKVIIITSFAGEAVLYANPQIIHCLRPALELVPKFRPMLKVGLSTSCLRFPKLCPQFLKKLLKKSQNLLFVTKVTQELLKNKQTNKIIALFLYLV